MKINTFLIISAGALLLYALRQKDEAIKKVPASIVPVKQGDLSLDGGGAEPTPQPTNYLFYNSPNPLYGLNGFLNWLYSIDVEGYPQQTGVIHVEDYELQ